MIFNRQRLGIDLGTVNTVIYIEDRGVALREPSLVVVDHQTNQIIAFGKEAAAMIGHLPEHCEVISPLVNGVIAHLNYTKEMLAFFIRKALIRKLSNPDVVICVPSNITKLEHKALTDTIKGLGITRAMIIEEPYAAALGAKLNIEGAEGQLICDIGGGTTDIAILSYQHIIKSQMLKIAGNQFDDAIRMAIRQHYQIKVSPEDAEALKIKLASAIVFDDEREISEKVQGRHIVTQLPTEQAITKQFILESIDPLILEIITAIQKVLELVDVELSVDILSNGITLTGGGALLPRLGERIEKVLKIPVNITDSPLDAVAMGAGQLIKNMTSMSKQG